MLHATHILPFGLFPYQKWNAVIIVEVIKRIRIRLQTDTQADRQTEKEIDRRTSWNRKTPPNKYVLWWYNEDKQGMSFYKNLIQFSTSNRLQCIWVPCVGYFLRSCCYWQMDSNPITCWNGQQCYKFCGPNYKARDQAVYITYWCEHITVTSHERLASKITGHSSVCSTICSVNINEIKKPCVTNPFWGESPVDRWIPHTKGQQRGEMFSCHEFHWKSFHDNDCWQNGACRYDNSQCPEKGQLSVSIGIDLQVYACFTIFIHKWQLYICNCTCGFYQTMLKMC